MAFDFVTHFLDVTRIAESPTSYLEWAAYVSLAATMRHKVYFSMPSRQTRVTPNIYVLLVGDSGATRKSTPLKIASSILRKANVTKLIEGRASIQGILNELAKAEMVNKKKIEFAGGILYSEEFAAFLVKDPSTSGILTDIYDFKESHDIILKTQDTLRLHNVAVTLFAATNMVFLQDMFSKTDVYGGLVARTVFIIEERARHKNSGLKDTATDGDFVPLVKHLDALSRVSGPVQLHADALAAYDYWYLNTDFTLNESKTGFEHRMHTLVQKMCIIKAASREKFDLRVELADVEWAIQKVTSLRANYHRIVTNLGVSSVNLVVSAQQEIMVKLITVPGKIARQDLLAMLVGTIDVETFTKAIESLYQAGMITIEDALRPKYGLSERAKETLGMLVKGRDLVQ